MKKEEKEKYVLYNIDLIGPGASINGKPLNVVEMDLKSVPVVFEGEEVGSAHLFITGKEYVMCSIELDNDIVDKLTSMYIHIAFELNNDKGMDIIGLNFEDKPQKPNQETLGYIIRQNLLTADKVRIWKARGWARKRINKQLEKLADANGRRKN